MEMVQVIVHCKEYDRRINGLESIGQIKYKLPMIDAYVIEIEETNLDKIKSLDGLIRVEMDTHITAQMNRVRNLIDLPWAHQNNITGKGVGVAVLDTGLGMHRDFIDNSNRVIAFKDMLNKRREPYDDNGHGTHVCGIIGGNGYSSKGKYIGVAPECNLIGVKVLDRRGDGNISDVLAGLQWITCTSLEPA